MQRTMLATVGKGKMSKIWSQPSVNSSSVDELHMFGMHLYIVVCTYSLIYPWNRDESSTVAFLLGGYV